MVTFINIAILAALSVFFVWRSYDDGRSYVDAKRGGETDAAQSHYENALVRAAYSQAYAIAGGVVLVVAVANYLVTTW